MAVSRSRAARAAPYSIHPCARLAEVARPARAQRAWRRRRRRRRGLRSRRGTCQDKVVRSGPPCSPEACSGRGAGGGCQGRSGRHEQGADRKGRRRAQKCKGGGGAFRQTCAVKARGVHGMKSLGGTDAEGTEAVADAIAELAGELSAVGPRNGACRGSVSR